MEKPSKCAPHQTIGSHVCEWHTERDFNFLFYLHVHTQCIWWCLRLSHVVGLAHCMHTYNVCITSSVSNTNMLHVHVLYVCTGQHSFISAYQIIVDRIEISPSTLLLPATLLLNYMYIVQTTSIICTFTFSHFILSSCLLTVFSRVSADGLRVYTLYIQMASQC